MKFDIYNAEHIRLWSRYIKTNEPWHLDQFEEKAFDIKDQMAAAWVARILDIDEADKMNVRLEQEIKDKRKANLEAKPKGARVLELMAQGWELHSWMVVRGCGGVSWMLIEKGGKGRLDVNGKTAESLIHQEKIEALPNEYPMVRPTIYRLVKCDSQTAGWIKVIRGMGSEK